MLVDNDQGQKAFVKIEDVVRVLADHLKVKIFKETAKIVVKK